MNNSGKIAKGEYLGIYEKKKILFRDFAEEYLKWCESNKAKVATNEKAKCLAST